MKCRGIIFGLAFLILVCGTLAAQSENTLYSAESTYYKVYSEVSMTHAEETADQMDSYLEFYNGFFHFDTDSLAGKLRIRIFQDKAGFDEYLSSIISERKDSFVFIQYRDLNRSELVGFIQDEELYHTALVHQGCIQFLKAFIPEPPLWLQKGFAIYLEESRYDEDLGSVVFKPNMGWVETLKRLSGIEATGDGAVNNLFPLSTFTFIDVETAKSKIETFYAQSWGMISFLAESEDKVYNRMLWDALSVLNPEKDKRENENLVKKASFDWISSRRLQNDFLEYVGEIKTFADLVNDGMEYYSSDMLDASEQAFTQALTLDDGHYLPYYYLGLIRYAKNDYSMAEYYYHSAIQMGGAPGLTYYALGVNAFADLRYDDAVFYLEQAVENDPAGFTEKASSLIERIETENTTEASDP